MVRASGTNTIRTHPVCTNPGSTPTTWVMSAMVTPNRWCPVPGARDRHHLLDVAVVGLDARVQRERTKPARIRHQLLELELRVSQAGSTRLPVQHDLVVELTDDSQLPTETLYPVVHCLQHVEEDLPTQRLR